MYDIITLIQALRISPVGSLYQLALTLNILTMCVLGQSSSVEWWLCYLYLGWFPGSNAIRCIKISWCSIKEEHRAWQIYDSQKYHAASVSSSDSKLSSLKIRVSYVSFLPAICLYTFNCIHLEFEGICRINLLFSCSK